MAYDYYLEEVKQYLHVLHDHDDANLSRLIEEGEAMIMHYCGPVNIADNLIAKQLVFDYVRFAYNGMSEHFYPQFKARISELGMALMIESGAFDELQDT